MELTTAQIAAWVGAFMYPLMRVGAAAMVAPVFGNDMIPVRVRVFIGFGLTVAIMPAVGPVPAVDPLSAHGLMIGFVLALALNTVVIAGESVALAMGLGFATMVDPQTGMSVPVISQVLLVITTLLFLALGGHLVLIQLVADSFSAIPIGGAGLTRDAFWDIAAWGSQLFAGAVLIALPVVMVLLVINLALGVMTRAAPQMNVFSVGLPVTLLVGSLLIPVMLLPALPHRMAGVWRYAYDTIGALLGVPG